MTCPHCKSTDQAGKFCAECCAELPIETPHTVAPLTVSMVELPPITQPVLHPWQYAVCLACSAKQQPLGELCQCGQKMPSTRAEIELANQPERQPPTASPGERGSNIGPDDWIAFARDVPEALALIGNAAKLGKAFDLWKSRRNSLTVAPCSPAPTLPVYTTPSKEYVAVPHLPEEWRLEEVLPWYFQDDVTVTRLEGTRWL